MDLVRDRLRLAADVLLHGPTDPEPAAFPPVDSAWEHVDCVEARQEAALAMLDDEVAGYFLVLFRQHENGVRCELDVSHVVGQQWWPAVYHALAAMAPQ